MSAFISRPASATVRKFPAIGLQLYENPQPSDPCSALLALSNGRYSPWGRFLGEKSAPLESLGRLFHFHKLALHNEHEGKWRLADFFWGEVVVLLRRVWANKALWEAVNRQIANADKLRRTLVNEVFVDMHCALYNGYSAQGHPLLPSSRAFIHLDYLDRILRCTETPVELQVKLLLPAMQAQINAHRHVTEYSSAIQLCTKCLKRFPEEKTLQETLINLRHAEVLSNVKNVESQSGYLADAEALEAGIERLKNLLQDYPRNVSIYYALGDLYHYRAAKLASARRIADALVSIRWALIHDPSLDSALRTQEQLFSLLQSLQTQLAKVEAEVAKQPGAYLNADGVALREQVLLAQRPVGELIPGDEAELITHGFHCSQARDLWLRIGLPTPADHWDERAMRLLAAMGSVLEHPPEQASLLRQAWLAVGEEHPDLKSLNPDPIVAFLCGRLFAAVDEVPACEQHGAIYEPPVIMEVTAKQSRSMETFGYWIFGANDWGTKALAISALLFLVVSAAMYVSETNNRNVRITAYQQLLAASVSGSSREVMDAAERFFSVRTFVWKDEREEKVRNLYGQALMKWFAQRAGEQDPEGERHLNRYVALLRAEKR